MFYTDTNGQVPQSRSTALAILAIVMETTPLTDINFERFNEITPILDSGAWEEL
jgi:hypothetical protein